MDEDLVGYLLNNLDPVTHQQVAAQLRHDPEARSRLEALRLALAPLEDDRAGVEPPAGLVQRTLALVAEHHPFQLPPAPAAPREQLGSPVRRWFWRIDVLVAACLLVLVGGLSTTALAQAWTRYQRTACARNLNQFWVSLSAYSDHHDNAFPRVEAEGARSVAGIFVPVLHDSGLLGDVSVGCPAQGRQAPPSHSVAELERLQRTAPEEFRRAAGALAGGYAYSLGYRENGVLCGLRRDCGDHVPIMADCPPAGGGNSRNHGGAGQNVLYIGGTVRWCVRPTVGIAGDDIYVNKDNRVLAGVHRVDTVLGASDAQPCNPVE
jgi:hypothetical protein